MSDMPSQPKGGRPPAPIRSEFETLGSSATANRPGAKCKHCNTQFSASQAKPSNLLKHITKDCTKVPKNVRDKWIVEAADGQDQRTDGEDAVQLGKRRRDSMSSSSSSIQLDVRRYGRGQHSLPKEVLTKEEKKQADFSHLCCCDLLQVHDARLQPGVGLHPGPPLGTAAAGAGSFSSPPCSAAAAGSPVGPAAAATSSTDCKALGTRDTITAPAAGCAAAGPVGPAAASPVCPALRPADVAYSCAFHILCYVMSRCLVVFCTQEQLHSG